MTVFALLVGLLGLALVGVVSVATAISVPVLLLLVSKKVGLGALHGA